jgi:hypothetical protein
MADGTATVEAPLESIDFSKVTETYMALMNRDAVRPKMEQQIGELHDELYAVSKMAELGAAVVNENTPEGRRQKLNEWAETNQIVITQDLLRRLRQYNVFGYSLTTSQKMKEINFIYETISEEQTKDYPETTDSSARDSNYGDILIDEIAKLASGVNNDRLRGKIKNHVGRIDAVFSDLLGVMDSYVAERLRLAVRTGKLYVSDIESIEIDFDNLNADPLLADRLILAIPRFVKINGTYTELGPVADLLMLMRASAEETNETPFKPRLLALIDLMINRNNERIAKFRRPVEA